MIDLITTTCSRCSRPVVESDVVCGLCGTLLRRSPARVTRTTEQRAPSPVTARPWPADVEQHEPSSEPWLYLGVGALTAPVFAMTPLLGYMGWFLASLIHEMGHAGFAWLCGMPAFPVISLDGHAAAFHEDQKSGLVLMIGLGLCGGAWRILHGRSRIAALVLICALYPAIAFTDDREILHLLAGHGAELAFATLALWKALDGGFTQSNAERALYSTVGWFLLGKNVDLCWGLLRSDTARMVYTNGGSFGLTNDYLRVAEDLLGWRLESVAFLMLMAALLVVPCALLAWRVRSRMRSLDA